MGPAQSQDGSMGQLSQLFDNEVLIGRRNGVAHYHQVELSVFTCVDRSREPYGRFNLKSLAAKQ